MTPNIGMRRICATDNTWIGNVPVYYEYGETIIVYISRNNGYSYLTTRSSSFSCSTASGSFWRDRKVTVHDLNTWLWRNNALYFRPESLSILSCPRRQPITPCYWGMQVTNQLSWSQNFMLKTKIHYHAFMLSANLYVLLVCYFWKTIRHGTPGQHLT